MTDFLDQKRTEITERLRELEPLVEEFRRLQDAATALAGLNGSQSASASPSASAAPTARRDSGRASKGRAARSATATVTKSPSQGRRRGGRPKGSGTRAAQALTLVQGQPGITISELAAKMNIKQNYLYRVLPGLEQDGKITKQGRGWHLKG